MKSVSLIVFAVTVALATATAGESASKGVLCVGGPHCYSTVQAAVDAAGDGDLIRVGPGTFAGGVTITKSLTLAGVDAHASKISGGGPVVTIGSTTSAPTVTLMNLTISGGLTTSNPHAPECGLDVPVCGPGYADATAIGGGIETFAGTTVTLVAQHRHRQPRDAGSKDSERQGDVRERAVPGSVRATRLASTSGAR